jgi:mono/diheme cytochrome c family protein
MANNTYDNDFPIPSPDDDKPDPNLRNLDYSEDVNVGKIHESILRENKEPREGMEPVPLWLLAVIISFIFGCGIYLGLFWGGFSATAYDEDTRIASSGGEKGKGGGANGETAVAAGDPLQEAIKLGKRQYSNNCASCHQPTGMGVSGQYPPLAKSDIVTGPERHLLAVLLNGLEGHLTAQGVAYNGAMPAWGGNMNDKQVAAVSTFIRQEWGNSAGPITPEQVAAARKEFASHPAAYKIEEVEALPTTPIPGGAAAPGGEAKK